MDDRLISVVVPVYNEQDSLEPLLQEIQTTAHQAGYHLQVVFVDDGSRDGSWLKIKALAEADPSVGGLRFRRNRGKAAALMAGFQASRGDVVFMMDADLQDPPQEMPRLLQKLDQGYDVVSGWKKHRLDPWHKVYTSHVFNHLIGFLTGVHLHDHVCGLKCLRGEVARGLKLYGEMHRFVGVLAAADGYRVTEVATLHRPREHGVGKYGFTRFAKGFLDLITVWLLTRYRWRPQHLIGVTGLVVMIAALLARLPWSGALERLLLILAPGLILIAIGLVGELIVANRPLDGLYSISEKVGWCAERVEVSEEPLPGLMNVSGSVE